MNPLFRIPIRWQLIIIVVMVALPSAAIVISSGIKERNMAVAEARMDSKRLVDRIASEQRILVDSAQMLAASLSQMPEVRQREVAKVNQHFRYILRLTPQLSSLFVADSTGSVWAAAAPIPRPVTVSDGRFFQNAMATGQPSSGEFRVGKISGQPSITLGYPFKDRQDRIIGVICFGISLKHYRRILEQTELPERADIAILDHKGVYIFNATKPESFIGKQADPVLFHKMVQGPDASTSVDAGIMGDAPMKRRYVSYEKLRLEGEQTPYLYIRVGIPVESALSHADKTLAGNLSLFVLVLSTALFLAWLVGERSIAQRISTLERASQALASGALRPTVSDLVKGGELGRLGKAFDSMAEQLAAREESLSESRRFLDAIIDTEPEGLKMLDAEGRIVMMNRAGLNMIEAESFEHLSGQSILPLIAVEYRDAFKKLIRQIFQGIPGNLEHEVVSLNGRHAWVDFHAVPFRDDTGKIVSLLGISRDITGRKLAEKSLAEKQRLLEELNMNLEQRVADAVLDMRNKDQMMILQDRQAAMGEMIGNISHQWRQPLNTLGLILQDLRMTYGRPEFNEESLAASVNKALGLISHMSQTIHDFSNYFKPDKGTSPFSVNQVVARTLALVELSLRKLDIGVEVVEAEKVDASGRPNEYSQVLLNILLNSRDAFEESKIDRRRLITITIFRENDRSVVTVADNAGGIPEEALERIFDPYFTTKSPEKGTGIGLYMSKSIIEKGMGGSLTARNIKDGAELRIEV